MSSSLNDDDDKTHHLEASSTSARLLYEQDGDEAREIAQYLPYFPFKGIPRFYDIGGFLYEPAVFRRIVDIFVQRYRGMDVDVIAGYVRYTCVLVSQLRLCWTKGDKQQAYPLSCPFACLLACPLPLRA